MNKWVDIAYSITFGLLMISGVSSTLMGAYLHRPITYWALVPWIVLFVTKLMADMYKRQLVESMRLLDEITESMGEMDKIVEMLERENPKEEIVITKN